MRLSLLPAIAIALSFIPAAQAQHETGADLFSGAQVYQNLCANCHGLDGALVPNVDLGHGVFRQNYTDEQLVGIIQKGIPNTPMPPNPNMSSEQAQLVVDYLRSRAVDPSASLAGNAANGRELFVDRGACNYCHMVKGEGEPTGPDLSRIGDIRSAAELTQSLREPNAVIDPNNRQYGVTTKDGTSITGRLMNQDSFTVQLMDPSGKLRSFSKADLNAQGFAPSPMGALSEQEWTDQEVADLVAYLASLRVPAAATGATP
ncbi:MAG: Cytochrome c oxidase subunit [Pseudomonadota bacterium]|jgi:putative heme-binding domain-containing protein